MTAKTPTIDIQGHKVPTLVYGTAWKEEDTERLTRLAIEEGFVGIDTANQRRHYHEAGDGAALNAAIRDGLITRDGLFLQTKYTFQSGQDHRLPYDPDADIGTQVRQSFQSSLEHLHTDYLDAYILHGPATGHGLVDADREAWRAMESLHRDGLARLIGVSNVNAEQLRLLLGLAQVKPAIVQNRCYASRGWDREVRGICEMEGIVYQGFSLLTANRRELEDPRVAQIAARRQLTLPQVVFRFAAQLGMQPLTGTTDPEHMRHDLESLGAALSDEEVATLERIGG